MTWVISIAGVIVAAMVGYNINQANKIEARLNPLAETVARVDERTDAMQKTLASIEAKLAAMPTKQGMIAPTGMDFAGWYGVAAEPTSIMKWSQQAVERNEPTNVWIYTTDKAAAQALKSAIKP
jgi:hypothetical protein